jgi:outer membrane protein assembly factor BamB
MCHLLVPWTAIAHQCIMQLGIHYPATGVAIVLRQKRNFLLCGFVGFLICGVTLVSSAEEPVATLVRSSAPDWPQWRGPRRDGVSDEKGLLQSWPAGGPKLLWTASGIGRGYSSPIVVDETIYITGDQDDDLIISALSTDGSLRWRSTNGDAWQRSYPGARSSCTYDESRLFHMNAHGRLACLEATTGTEVWAVNVLERFEAKNITWGISESLIVHKDQVFVTPAGVKGLAAGLDKQTGATVWATPQLGEERASYGPPILVAIGEQCLLVSAGSRHSFAVDVDDGKLCWQMRHLDPGSTITTTPILSDDRLVFTNTSRSFGGIYGVQLEGAPTDRAWSENLKIGHGGMVCVDGRLFGASSGRVAKGWVAVDATTGDAVNLGGELRGSVIYADQRFYCLTERGTIMLQEMTPDGFRSTGSFQLTRQKDVWTHPVICHGRLYLRYHDTLFCYDVRR